MAIRGKIWVLGFLVASLFIVSGCSSSDSSWRYSDGPWQNNKIPPSVELTAQNLIYELSQQGLEVERGYFKLYTTADCAYSYEIMHTCYGNNPAAPYVVPVMPYWPQEFVDPATRFAFGPTEEGYGVTYRCDQSEAIIIFGLLPPPAAYCGLQTYLFTREGTYDTSSPQYQYFANFEPGMLDTFFSTIPNNPKRIQLLASLSNSINNVVIERQSGSAFDQVRYFIITPDQNMDEAVRSAFGQISVDQANIFTEPLPPTVWTGIDEPADDFLSVIRYAMPYDHGYAGTPSDTWRKDLPLVVLRVRDAGQARPPEPYDPVQLEARTADAETWLNTDLTQLTLEVSDKWGQLCANPDCSDMRMNFIDMQAPPMTLVGPDCTEIGMNCLGDTQDTTYQLGANLPLDNDEVYAAIGTLGTTTGNATYVGLSVNYSLTKKGVANINSEQLQDTALEFAGTVDHADKYYVYYLTRDCSGLEALTGGHCLSVPETMIPPCSAGASEPCGYLKLVQREYIRPGTQRGPDSKLILLPRILKLQRP
jgi:hypothetical protein